MSLGTILIIVLLLMVLGVLSTWPNSGCWGYLPSGALGLGLVIVLAPLLRRNYEPAGVSSVARPPEAAVGSITTLPRGRRG